MWKAEVLRTFSSGSQGYPRTQPHPLPVQELRSRRRIDECDVSRKAFQESSRGSGLIQRMILWQDAWTAGLLLKKSPLRSLALERGLLSVIANFAKVRLPTAAPDTFRKSV